MIGVYKMPNLLMRSIVKGIEKILCHAVAEEGKSKFVIYTNGMGGKIVKEYLDSEFHIKPEYTIDNKVYNGKEVLSIEQAKKRDNHNVYFLISSWHNDYYDEIRKRIYEAFPREQIIDLFPHTEEKLPTDEEICQVLKIVESFTAGMEDESCL
jgi:hypothetical protein